MGLVPLGAHGPERLNLARQLVDLDLRLPHISHFQSCRRASFHSSEAGYFSSVAVGIFFKRR